MPDTLMTRWSESLGGPFPPKESKDPTCCLVCIHPSDRLGRVVTLGSGALVVGRETGCELELVDDSVSRRHAVLRPTPGGYTVIDLDSTNGTYVNDVRIETRKLEPGDRLRFGNQIFKYLSGDRFEAEFLEASYRMMTTDGLTQTFNKRYLLDVAQRELRHTRRTGRPLSLLLIDVDHFKAVNDTHGHLAGDEVLIELGSRLRGLLRGDEVLARYGGEEFCLLLPETTLDEARQVAERVRVAVERTVFPTERATLNVTVSIGVATTGGQEDMTVAQLIDQADRKLYEAKRGGRNQIAV